MIFAISDEILGAIITVVGGGVLGLFGWLVRGSLEGRKRKREQDEQRKRSQVAALGELDRLLDTTNEAFRQQIRQAMTLMASLKQDHPEVVSQRLGYDDTFRVLYPHFTPAQHELFLLIRGTTVGSMRETNTRLRDWLDHHPDIHRELSDHETLHEQLKILARHLREWDDKYNAVFATEDRRSVVFLNDEKAHGTGFPKGIESEVKAVLAEKVAELQATIKGNAR